MAKAISPVTKFRLPCRLRLRGLRTEGLSRGCLPLPISAPSDDGQGRKGRSSMAALEAGPAPPLATIPTPPATSAPPAQDHGNLKINLFPIPVKHFPLMPVEEESRLHDPQAIQHFL